MQANDLTSLSSDEMEWAIRFLSNLLAYATLIVPVYLLKLWLENNGKFENSGKINAFVREIRFLVFRRSPLGHIAVAFYEGRPAAELLPTTTEPTSNSASPAKRTAQSEATSTTHRLLVFVFCAAGLQGSYLTWGVLQEKLMTQNYAK